MKKLFTLCIALCVAYAANAQYLRVSSGAGRINDNTILVNQPFKVTKMGSWAGGTPREWAAGIGTVNGNNIDHFTSNTSRNVIINRPISGNTALISTEGTNSQYGLSRFLTICDAQLNVFVSRECFGNSFAEFFITVSETGSYSGTRTYRIKNSSGTVVASTTTSSSSFFWSTFAAGSYTVEMVLNNCNSAVITESFFLTTSGCSSGGPILQRGETEEGQWNADRVGLYPNPSAGNDHITVELAEELSGFDMEVLDINGRVLKTAPITGRESDLYIGDLREGVYLIRFKSDKYQGTRRLVID